MYASSLMPGIIVPHALYMMICARSSEYRPERGFQARSGIYIVSFRTRGQDPRVTRVALRQAAVSVQKYGSAGQIRRSAENNSRVTVTRPTSDPYITGHDPTRLVTF